MVRGAKRLTIALAITATNCSWCSGPKATTTQEDDPSDLDSAPHELDLRARCGEGPSTRIALPTTSDATFEIGRVRTFKDRVVIGARRGSRAGVIEVDGMTARFTETSDALGDAPPPIPIITADRVVAVAYEGAAKARRLVARDVASPQTPIFTLDPEPPDESLAFDAIALSDGALAVAWDQPAETGSAIWARTFRNGKLDAAHRLSPDDVDADSPRLLSFGPALVAMWIAHRALPRIEDAQVQPEGPGQDLDHAWIEMLAFDASTLTATSPLRHVTPDTGRVTMFNAQADPASALPAMNVIARDGIELHAGQGGSALLVTVRGPEPSPPIVLTNRLGRGLPLFLESQNLLLFEDAAGVGRSATDSGVALESFASERPLVAMGENQKTVFFARERATELHVFLCSP